MYAVPTSFLDFSTLLGRWSGVGVPVEQIYGYEKRRKENA